MATESTSLSIDKSPNSHGDKDRKILRDIENAIWIRTDIDTSRVEVAVEKELVTLSGYIVSLQAKDMILDIVVDVPGVKEIISDMEVDRRFH